jgi:hypothetical protein
VTIKKNTEDDQVKDMWQKFLPRSFASLLAEVLGNRNQCMQKAFITISSVKT